MQALLTQGVVTVFLILSVGTEKGQEMINRVLTNANLQPLSWEGPGGFETLLKFTTPVFWLFFLLTGLSLFVLRERDRDIDRPFRVPLYPLLPLVFCGACVYMLHSGINYAGALGLAGPMLLLIGLLLYSVSPRRRGVESPALSEA